MKRAASTRIKQKTLHNKKEAKTKKEEEEEDMWQTQLVADTQILVLRELDPLALYLFSLTSKHARAQCCPLFTQPMPPLWSLMGEYASTIAQADWAMNTAWPCYKDMELYKVEDEILVYIARNNGNTASVLAVTNHLIQYQRGYTGGYLPYEALLREAMKMSNFMLAMALCDAYSELIDSMPLECLVRSGTVSMLEWFSRKDGFVRCKGQMQANLSDVSDVVKAGNLPVLQWLWDHNPPGIYYNYSACWSTVIHIPPVNYAAVYQWLWKHEGERHIKDPYALQFVIYETSPEWTADAHKYYLKHSFEAGIPHSFEVYKNPE